MWQLPGWVGLVVLGLACWRISSLIVREDGPYSILAKIRARIGVYYDEYSQPQGKNVIASAITCVWCTSVWVGLALAVFSEYSRNFASFLWVALALSAIAIVTDQFIELTKAR